MKNTMNNFWLCFREGFVWITKAWLFIDISMYDFKQILSDILKVQSIRTISSKFWKTILCLLHMNVI